MCATALNVFPEKTDVSSLCINWLTLYYVATAVNMHDPATSPCLDLSYFSSVLWLVVMNILQLESKHAVRGVMRC